jgi:hypothetical protein
MSVISFTIAYNIYMQYFDKENMRKIAQERTTKRQSFAFQSALVLFSVSVLYFAALVIGVLLLYLQEHCATNVRIAAPIFIAAKGMMYGLWITRVDAVYAGTPMAYSKNLTRTLLAITAVTSLTAMTLSVVLADSSMKAVGNHWRTCATEFPVPLIALTISQDVITSLICLHMFTRPLAMLVKTNLVQFQVQYTKRRQVTAVASPTAETMSSERTESTRTETHTGTAGSSDQNSSPEAATAKKRARAPTYGDDLERSQVLRRLAVKTTIVTWVAVMSTFIVLLTIVVTRSMMLAAIDMVVNTVCSCLMTSWFDRYYERICAPSLWCAKNICQCELDTKETLTRMMTQTEDLRIQVVEEEA